MIKIISAFVLIIFLIICYLLRRLFPEAHLLQDFLGEASGAAIGGYFGAYVVWILRELYVRKLKKTKPVVTYYANENPRGLAGTLIPKRVKSISKGADIKNILAGNVDQEVTDNGLWEIEISDKEEYVFYGPYSYDLTEPGSYEVIFHYFATGFESGSDKEALMQFDVIQRTEKWEHIYEGQNRTTKHYIYQQTKSIIPIYCKNFENFSVEEKKYGRAKSLRFYYDGNGDCEYRVKIRDGIMDDANGRLNKYLKDGKRIFFFKVVVNRIFDIEVPNP